MRVTDYTAWIQESVLGLELRDGPGPGMARSISRVGLAIFQARARGMARLGIF